MQDPRERPADKQTQADQSHPLPRRALGLRVPVNLWRYLKAQQKALSSSAFRRMCKSEFLHYLRVREWQDPQPAPGMPSAGDRPDQATATDEYANADLIHQSLLAGLLSHIGLRDEVKRDYLGARGAGSPSHRARRCSADSRRG